MKLYIDADGCPVVDLAIKTGAKFGVQSYIISDTSHIFQRDDATVITVCKGADSVDFALVNRLEKGDIAVTQDYGLAAMCMARHAYVINQDGIFYNEKNIDTLLTSRHTAKKNLFTGIKLKGQPKRTEAQNRQFEKNLTEFFDQKFCNINT